MSSKVGVAVSGWPERVSYVVLALSSASSLSPHLLRAVIYLNIQVVKGQRKVIRLLKEQIRNEGEDKIFLINKLHSVYEEEGRSR